MNYGILGHKSSLNNMCDTPADRIRYQSILLVVCLGVLSYALSISSSDDRSNIELAASLAYNASNQPIGDTWNNTGGADVCSVYEWSVSALDLRGLIVDGRLLAMAGKPVPSTLYYRHDDAGQTVEWL